VQVVLICTNFFLTYNILICVLCFIQSTETGVEDDTPESDACLSDVNRKRLLDSSEDSSVDMPRIKSPCIDAENVTSE